MIKKITFASLFLFLLASPLAAARQPSATVYIGAGVGQSELNDICSGLDRCDNKDTSKKFILGYQFNPSFAFEFAYADLGEATADFENSFSGTIISWHLALPVESTSVNAIAQFPLNETFSLFGRLGYGKLKIAFEADRLLPDNYSITEKEQYDGLIYGAGISATFDDAEFRLGYEKYPEFKEDFGSSDIDAFGIEALLHFH